jgi:hypothetical protein
MQHPKKHEVYMSMGNNVGKVGRENALVYTIKNWPEF